MAEVRLSRSAFFSSATGCAWVAIGLAGLWICLGAKSAHASTPGELDAALAFVNEQVKPLLTANCIKCHGGQTQIKGGLRLTTHESILKGGDDGPVITLDHPEKSLLLAAINYVGDIKMPPDGKLAPEQIATLSRWVKEGAAWPAGLDLTPANVAQAPASGRPDPPTPEAARKSFWAFQPVRRPAPPTVKDTAWVRNPIDAFVLAKLEAGGFKPAPPADNVSLIRRATYDLTGLPPTPAEVDAFVADPAPDAYEKLVDRLLDSPHYGEKWGRHWLDLVRYGETNSYERDNPKPNVWRFRDYVIRSFNADKPYDRFVKEQLAGDEMPEAASSYDPIIATAYYRLGIWDDEPSDRLQARYDNLDDVVTTTGQVFLGLTIDCARCHNHKIDPILQTDYYRLLAFFQNIRPFGNGGPGDEVEMFTRAGEREAYAQRMAERIKRVDAIQLRLNAIAAEFSEKYSPPAHKPLGRTADIEDLRYRYYRDSWEKLPDFENIKPESAGTLADGLFDIGVRTRDTAFGFVFTGDLIVPQDGQYTFYLDSDDGSRLTIDGKPVLLYDGIHGIGQQQKMSVALAKGRRSIKLEYFQNVGGLGLQVEWSGPGVERRPLSTGHGESQTSQLTAIALGTIIFEQGEAVLGHKESEEYRSLRRELDEQKAPPEHPRALCVSEPGPQVPQTYVCLRGNANVQGQFVEPGFPKVFSDTDATIPPPPQGARSSGRRTVLADWITSDANPLFTRVMANRIFQYHFGRGIVRSPNNFGVQGDAPTHPELLEWLASEFKAQGLRLKPMHRLIMTSNAYRMSCAVNPAALAADPRNDLLWRFDLRRLTAEEVRDSILAVDGSLNAKMFGPSIYPAVSKEVMAGQTHPGEDWNTTGTPEDDRRSVYVHFKRSLPVPILQAFDAAETDRSCPVRFATVQPTQALGMINGGFLNEQASKLADRLKHECGDDQTAQITQAFKLTTGRAPTADELRRAGELIRSLHEKDGATPQQAKKYFCLMMLNLNAFVFID